MRGRRRARRPCRPRSCWSSPTNPTGACRLASMTRWRRRVRPVARRAAPQKADAGHRGHSSSVRQEECSQRRRRGTPQPMGTRAPGSCRQSCCPCRQHQSQRATASRAARRRVRVKTTGDGASEASPRRDLTGTVPAVLCLRNQRRWGEQGRPASCHSAAQLLRSSRWPSGQLFHVKPLPTKLVVPAPGSIEPGRPHRSSGPQCQPPQPP